jgi:serine/alanine adding enzyme
VCAVADLDALRNDDRAWDAFVESTADGQYLQMSAWAKVKAPNGWRSVRVVADGGSGPIGAQVLLHRLGPLPFALGYATCGPVATLFDKASVDAFTAELRTVARRERLSHVTIDPTVGEAQIGKQLRSAGWRKTKTVQVDQTWVVDVDQPEEALWQGLRSKWRQYVQKGRKNRLEVVDAGADGIDDLFRIVVETANRAGFVYRSKETYRRVYDAYAATDHARLLLAKLPTGEAVAALMLVACDGKIVEPYGGMTAAGAESRANYLLKWEAIRSSAERGYRLYDMWGMATAGIGQFKQGFGGRQVDYIGAFDLVTSQPLRAAFRAYHGVNVRIGRLRRGDRGRPTGPVSD